MFILTQKFYVFCISADNQRAAEYMALLYYSELVEYVFSFSTPYYMLFSYVSLGCISLSLLYLFYLFFFFLYTDIYLFLMDFRVGGGIHLSIQIHLPILKFTSLAFPEMCFFWELKLIFTVSTRLFFIRDCCPASWELLSVTVSIRLWATVLWVPVKLCSNSYSEVLRVGKCGGT